MGIKDLNSFLKQNAGECVQEVVLGQLKGKKVAIDTSIYFYKFLYKNPRFIEGFFQQIFRLRSNGITPIYVFDGKPPQEKSDTIEHRKNKKIEYKNKLAECQSKLNNQDNLSKEEESELKETVMKLKKKMIYVTKENIAQLKYFLDLLCVKYIQAEGEADNICSQLCKTGVVDLVLSDDMDLLVSGTTVLLRNFVISSNRITLYNVNSILNKLGFTREQWVDFCIMCGSDYTHRIGGIGPKNAFKFLKLYGNIETVVENVCGEGKKYKVPENFDYVRARNIFNGNMTQDNLEKYLELDISLDNIDFFDNQLKNVKDYARTYTNLSDKQVLNRMKKIYNIDDNLLRQHKLM